MAEIAFVACSKSKSQLESPACLLYTSPLFRKSLLAAVSKSTTTYIMSAKHGIVGLDERLAPYDVTISKMSRHDRLAWAALVESQMHGILKRGDTATFYCGESYLSPLRGSLARLGCKISLPLDGLSLGQRLQKLRVINKEEHLSQTLDRFYKIINNLYVAQDGGRRLSDCSGKLVWPRRGVYFILDGNAAISRVAVTRGAPHRIVRIGTHAVSKGSRTTLWDRLSTHRGTAAGSGSHRSSIFRLHVGKALTSRSLPASRPPSWGTGQTAALDVRQSEMELEHQVSKAVGEMRVLWLQVSDDPGPASDRAYIERNTIGLLSRSHVLNPSVPPYWLGLISDEPRIVLSGLWNLDHLFYDPDPTFLDVLEHYVAVTLGKLPHPPTPIAPVGWHPRADREETLKQLSLWNSH